MRSWSSLALLSACCNEDKYKNKDKDKDEGNNNKNSPREDPPSPRVIHACSISGDQHGNSTPAQTSKKIAYHFIRRHGYRGGRGRGRGQSRPLRCGVSMKRYHRTITTYHLHCRGGVRTHTTSTKLKQRAKQRRRRSENMRLVQRKCKATYRFMGGVTGTAGGTQRRHFGLLYCFSTRACRTSLSSDNLVRKARKLSEDTRQREEVIPCVRQRMTKRKRRLTSSRMDKKG